MLQLHKILNAVNLVADAYTYLEYCLSGQKSKWKLKMKKNLKIVLQQLRAVVDLNKNV